MSSVKIQDFGLNPLVYLKFDKYQEQTDYEDNKNYVYLTGRALSKSILKGSFYLDFSHGDVLKSSLDKLKGKTVFANHNIDVSKWVGKVVNTEWDESRTPEGINFVLKMPSVNNSMSTEYTKNIVKGVMEGVINSFSVGVVSKMKMSHPDMEIVEFLQKQGETVDGQIVRLIVDEIEDFGELSVVYEGRDPSAKLYGMYMNNNFSKENALESKYDLLEKIKNIKESSNNSVIENNEQFSLNEDSKKEEKGEIQEMEKKANAKINTEEQENISTDSHNNNDINAQMQANLSKQDKLQERMSDLLKELDSVKKQALETEKSNLNLRKMLEQEKLTKENLNQNYKEKEYNYFKTECLREGLIFEDQLMLDENGNEGLSKLYLSLNEEQVLLFKEFVRNSPVKTLLDLSKKSSVKEEESVNPSAVSRSEFVGYKISEYAKLNNLSTSSIYSDDNLYNKLVSKFNKEYGSVKL